MPLITSIVLGSPVGYVDIDGFSADYNRFRIVGQGIRPSAVDPTSVTFLTTMRRSGQVNPDNAGYHFRTTTQDSGSTIFDNRQSHTAGQIEVTNLNVLNATNPANEDYPLDFDMVIHNPFNTAFFKQLEWSALWTNNGLYKNKTVGNAVNLRKEAIEGMRFGFSSGNIAKGSFYLYGLED